MSVSKQGCPFHGLIFLLIIFFQSINYGVYCAHNMVQSLAGQQSDKLVSPELKKRIEVLREIQVGFLSNLSILSFSLF